MIEFLRNMQNIGENASCEHTVADALEQIKEDNVSHNGQNIRTTHSEL